MKSKIRRRRTLPQGLKRKIRRRGSGPSQPLRRETGVLVGGAHDPAEKAADRAADQVMAGGRAGALAAGSAGIHRACAECDKKEEKEDKARRSASRAPTVAPGAKPGRAGPKASASIRSMGPGKPLARVERAFFEPRFGKDLSAVRIHDGPAADRAARSIDARAFAWGRDIAFAAGERERGGPRLLSHELAHFAAGSGTARRVVHRATISTEDGPRAYKKVPWYHRLKVQRALSLVEKTIGAKRCKDYFKDNCAGGAADTALKTFDAATVYHIPEKGEGFGLSARRMAAGDPHIIAYNETAYEIGHWEIAATLLHELFHTCDMTRDNLREIRAEQAAEVCGFYSPWILNVSPGEVRVGDTISVEGYQFGQTQDADHFIKFSGFKVASYSKWKQSPGKGSSVEVEFKVPRGSDLAASWWDTRTVTAVNHGKESNAKTVKIKP